MTNIKPGLDYTKHRTDRRTEFMVTEFLDCSGWQTGHFMMEVGWMIDERVSSS